MRRKIGVRGNPVERMGNPIRVDEDDAGIAHESHEETLSVEVFDGWFAGFSKRYAETINYLHDH